MPVIPDFSSFAQTPNLGGDYLQGAQIAQSAIQHAQELQMQREQLSQHAAQAQMEFQAKQADFQQNQMRYQQQMAIDKAYKDATIGWHQGQLEDKQKQATAAAALHLSQLEQKKAQDDAIASWHAGQLDIGQQNVDVRSQAATQKAALQQQLQNRTAAYQEPDYMGEVGEDPMSLEAASKRAMLELGPNQFGGAGTAAVRGADQDVPGLGQITHPEGYPNMNVLRTGPKSVSHVAAIPPDLATLGPPPRGYENYGGKTLKVQPLDVPLQKELDRLVAVQDKDPGEMAYRKKLKGEKLTPTQEAMLSVYQTRQARIDELRDQIDKQRARDNAGPTNSIAPYIPSNVQNSGTNKFRWDPQNGLQPR